MDLLGHRAKGKLAKGKKERKKLRMEVGVRIEQLTKAAEARGGGRRAGHSSLSAWNLGERTGPRTAGSERRLLSDRVRDRRRRRRIEEVNFCHVIGSLSIGSDDDDDDDDDTCSSDRGLRKRRKKGAWKTSRVLYYPVPYSSSVFTRCHTILA